MKKIFTIGLLVFLFAAYSIVHFNNPYKDRIIAYWQRFQLSQHIGADQTVDYDMLATGLQNIISLYPSWYKPYEFAALFASTLNKINPTISTHNVDKLIAIARQGLQHDCDTILLNKILNTPHNALSGLQISTNICTHKQLPTLLALIYTTYKKDETLAQQLYFIAAHARQ